MTCETEMQRPRMVAGPASSLGSCVMRSKVFATRLLAHTDILPIDEVPRITVHDNVVFGLEQPWEHFAVDVGGAHGVLLIEEIDSEIIAKQSNECKTLQQQNRHD